jgi:hypothetical protein
MKQWMLKKKKTLRREWYNARTVMHGSPIEQSCCMKDFAIEIILYVLGVAAKCLKRTA